MHDLLHQFFSQLSVLFSVLENFVVFFLCTLVAMCVARVPRAQLACCRAAAIACLCGRSRTPRMLQLCPYFFLTAFCRPAKIVGATVLVQSLVVVLTVRRHHLPIGLSLSRTWRRRNNIPSRIFLCTAWSHHTHADVKPKDRRRHSTSIP